MPSRPFTFERRKDGDGDFVLCLNGIHTNPAADSWTDRAEEWFLRRTSHDVDAYEYHQTAIFGRLFSENRHLRNVVQLLAEYMAAGGPFRLHILAHSRGCEIARRLVVECGFRVESMHLFSAAIDPDFGRNGLGAALERGQVNRVRLYTSKSDGVLRWIAGASLGLYGRLGYTGPRNVWPHIAHRVEQTPRDTYNHGSWFSPGNFEESMQLAEWEIDNLPMR
jgi:pimeloyl-ACP methyl ester carboxylesterase